MTKPLTPAERHEFALRIANDIIYRPFVMQRDGTWKEMPVDQRMVDALRELLADDKTPHPG